MASAPQNRVLEFVVNDKPCPYLEGLRTKTRYRMIGRCSTEEYRILLEHGWRRFGKLFFFPLCEGCDACKSVRIDVAGFTPTRSMKRVLAKNKNTALRIRRPSLTADHLRLYEKYHRDMVKRRSWDREHSSSEDYFNAFVDGYESFGYEFLYYHDGRLIGVGLVDVLREGVSAVYFYYDPDFRHLSPGVFNVLTQIEVAKKNHIPYLYLGYMVKENQSLKYKERYQPLEEMLGRPDPEEPVVWLPYPITP